MPKIIIVADQHFGINGGNKSADYLMAFMNNHRDFYNDYLFPAIKEFDVKNIIDVGDTFDRREYTQNIIPPLARKIWFNPIKKMGLKIHCLIGNHTSVYKNTLESNTIKTLFPNGNGGSIVRYDAPKEVEIDGLACLMVPWICADNYNDCIYSLSQSAARVVFGHFELNGYELYKGVIHNNEKTGMDDARLQHFDFVGSGHFHEPSSQGVVHYLGAVGQYNWSDYNCDRGFTILDTKTLEKTFIKNPYNMFQELIFHGEETESPTFSQCSNKVLRIVNKGSFKDQTALENFQKKVESFSPLSVKISNAKKIMETVNVAASVEMSKGTSTFSLFENYIDSKEIPNKYDKETLKQILKDTYFSSQ